MIEHTLLYMSVLKLRFLILGGGKRWDPKVWMRMLGFKLWNPIDCHRWLAEVERSSLGVHSLLRAAMTSCHKEGALNRNVFSHTSGGQSLKSIVGSFSQALRKRLWQGSLLALDGCWQSLASLGF